ncbi:OLC1v1000687C1 [Oldenlandia corymbosa var. corymbosa]|uniref:OLC1v1000687C1 n=1 Tax=Oldenlandia corymbosa var. corymbosa TaxID=529605 RepID=A0AAV1D6H4_OLDCO|nr:OLC1v1000687C1 [Oldenlandia corymbosa var. corymbosa]
MMALSSTKGVVVPVPVLVLAAAAAAIFLYLFVSSPSSSLPTPCSCPTIPPPDTTTPTTPSTRATAKSTGSSTSQRISASKDDIEWVRNQIEANGLHMAENVLRKGINPRTREQQLQDLLQFKGVSHYEGEEAENHTAFPCPGELLVEQHHSYYGEPWAGGRDSFDFLAESTRLTPDSRVLEIGCGTLRVGLHFIRYLNPEHYHCLEKDELSLMAAFRYELPSQGLLHKRPLIIRGQDMEFAKFGNEGMYDLIYSNAVFLHIPDKLVWVGLERLVKRLKPIKGRIFVSHNIKFCSRLGGEACTKKLHGLGLAYVGKHTHDSLLFNHYDIWYEFKRSKI